MNDPVNRKEFLLMVDATIDRLMTKKELSVTNVADELNMHSQRLQRLIKTITGKSSSEYIQQYRIEYAKHILIDNDMLTIAKIGYMCGFEEPTHFTRFFKRVTGITPFNFRQKEIQKNNTDI